MVHVHPALKKGISSAAQAIGQAASTAIAAAAAAAGGAGAAGGGGAAGAAGVIGPYVAGAIQQGGKIIEDVANVGSSFLVGNITGGTTANAYGVTQRGQTPGKGGTRVINASSNQYGDIYTNNIDDYFARLRRQDAQKAQASLGHWSR